MNRRPRSGAIAANPILIGAATVLVAVVAVFLAYNANNGLPFVPTYQLKAVLPNASGLIKGNEVRMGGARVGIVSRIQPLVADDGRTGAVLHLELERRIPRLPTDSRIKVRPRSPLGLKYLEITAGRARERFPDHATIPIANAAEQPVELDQFFGMFDEPTREGSQGNLTEFGTAFAGRGADLNETFRGLGPLVEHLEPAARAIADDATEFDDLFPAFEQAATEVAPVAQEQASMFGGLHTTFAALSGVREALQASISEGPRALEVATRELPAQAAFVTESEELFRELRPAFASLAGASDGLASAFREGEPALRRSPELNARLETTFEALERFTGDARVRPALHRLTRTANLLQPTIAFATPAQTTCNYLGLFFRNLESALSESDGIGSYLRFGILAPPQLPNSEAGPSSAPANGPPAFGTPQEQSLRDDSFLHTNPYPNTAAPGQERECEAASEGYQAGRQQIGNVPGNQGRFPEPTGRLAERAEAEADE